VKLDSAKMRWHRDRLGWTLDTLAEQAEVAEGTALRAEHGEDIRPSSGRRLARALGVDISELVPDQPGVVLPKAQPPPPKEVAAASQTAEEAGAAALQVAEEAAQASREVSETIATGSDITEEATAPPDEEGVNVVHLESADMIEEHMREISNITDLRNKRLVIDIHEDNSAEIRIRPSSSNAPRKQGSGRSGRYVQSGARKTRKKQARE
jgi:transcriptional regulator with XRE-family HTH domain